jgi:hypothetical protein
MNNKLIIGLIVVGFALFIVSGLLIANATGFFTLNSNYKLTNKINQNNFNYLKQDPLKKFWVLKYGCDYNNPKCNINQNCINNTCVPKGKDDLYLITQNSYITASNNITLHILTIIKNDYYIRLDTDFFINNQKLNLFPKIISIYKNNSDSNYYSDYAISLTLSDSNDINNLKVYLKSIDYVNNNNIQFSNCQELYDKCKENGKDEISCRNYCTDIKLNDEINLKKDGISLIIPSKYYSNDSAKILDTIIDCSYFVSQLYKTNSYPNYKIPIRFIDTNFNSIITAGSNGLNWPINSDYVINRLSNGKCNTSNGFMISHELTHYLFFPPPHPSIIDEGLAVYTEEKLKDFLYPNITLADNNDGYYYNKIICGNNSWHYIWNKYDSTHDNNEHIYMNLGNYLTPEYPYNIYSKDFYNTAYCFWKDIENQFGIYAINTDLKNELIKDTQNNIPFCIDKYIISKYSQNIYNYYSQKYGLNNIKEYFGKPCGSPKGIFYSGDIWNSIS